MSTVQTHVELKGHQTRLERFKADLKTLEREKSDVEERITGVRRKITEVEREVERLKSVPAVIVSEHAMLRYLERVMHIDMEDVRQRILVPEVVQAVSHFHSGNYPHPEGFSVRARENVITTVVNDGDSD